TVTTTNPDNSSSIQTFQNGRLLSETRKDSIGAQIGQTTYGYDAHGRRAIATDARNGTTTYGYDNADRVTSVTTPLPGTGQNAQTTTSFYDNLSRVWKVQQPDGNSVTNEYFTTGLLKKTYGSRTYPVEYNYDAQGRVLTMKTWKNFASGSPDVTTWN